MKNSTTLAGGLSIQFYSDFVFSVHPSVFKSLRLFVTLDSESVEWLYTEGPRLIGPIGTEDLSPLSQVHF